MKKYLKSKTAYKMKIGENVRKWRDVKGLKQQKLAAMLGLTPAALSNIENDITELTLQRIEDIADVLGLEPEQLLQNPHTALDISKDVHVSPNGNTDKDLLSRIVVLMENMNRYFVSVK